jgi:hypothetical protein
MPKKRSANIADTLTQAAKLAGVTVDVIRYARNHGCQAFNHGRVDMDQLKPWLAEHHDEIAASPSILKEQVQIKLGLQKLERGAWEWDVEKGKYISREEVGSTLDMIGQHQRAVLQRVLESELPPKLIGLDAVAISEVMRGVVDQICRILHDRTEIWQTSN